MKSRIFEPDTFSHVYARALNGNVIFYSQEDCLYYLSLYYKLSKRYGVESIGFCIMPNHIHSCERCRTARNFSTFHMELGSEFATNYNARHNRNGQLMDHSFGFAPKHTGKFLRACIIYIACNPVVGRITNNVSFYKWNLVAYYRTRHPYSEKIVKKRASKQLRRSIAILEYHYSRGNALNYDIQELLFGNLSAAEKKQLTDYAVSLYNPVDYNRIIHLFNGDYEQILAYMNTNSASEHDIKEDWEDYSIYSKMLRAVSSVGYSLSTVNFERCSGDELCALLQKLSTIEGAGEKQIRRFLHLPKPTGVQ